MKRNEFTIRLRAGLEGNVPASEVARQVEYYNEMILDLMEEGSTEEDAVAQVGDPNEIVFDMVGDDGMAAATAVMPQPATANRWLIVALIIIGSPLWGSLLLAALGLLFAAEVVLWCIPFTGLVTSGGFGIGGLAVFFASFPAFMHAPFLGVTELGMGLLCIGIGLLGGWITYKISAWFLRAHLALMSWVAGQFRRGKAAMF
jgi:uncharacterized membrane protein